ncbi:hypothetical protein IHE45_15G130400 [Dioscorea alata]|uniref:Uncharacterized protein n=1 Tax=Dioscorea alata TaxID=55571 RepID=A0ACB7UPG0_DIOAL|nr:hypothetical protein IHE45_15G130400 [Dioscorea alata]
MMISRSSQHQPLGDHLTYYLIMLGGFSVISILVKFGGRHGSCSCTSQLLMTTYYWLICGQIQGSNLFSGFTQLCKGFSVILVGGYVLLQIFPSAATYLALIPTSLTIELSDQVNFITG